MQGSVSPFGSKFGREHGIVVIDGSCPLMFLPKTDAGHKLLLRIGTWTEKVPRQV